MVLIKDSCIMVNHPLMYVYYVLKCLEIHLIPRFVTLVLLLFIWCLGKAYYYAEHPQYSRDNI